MLEKQLQGKLLKRLRSAGHYCIKIIGASRAGAPDIVTCQDGAFVAYECKTDVGRQSELQKYNQRMIEKSGGKYVLYRGDGHEQDN